jgi:hypothetical protein
MAVIVLLSLQAFPALGVEVRHAKEPLPVSITSTSAEGELVGIYEAAPTAMPGGDTQVLLGEAALHVQNPTPNTAFSSMRVEDPALAVLALAIISMAALCRRDSLFGSPDSEQEQ